MCNVQADIAAGLSVAAMVVPQGLSYAKLAGLPQVWGLYGAFAPCIVYAGFGSSKQLVRTFLHTCSTALSNLGCPCFYPASRPPLVGGNWLIKVAWLAPTMHLRVREVSEISVGWRA